jgi:hypothetical protein
MARTEHWYDHCSSSARHNAILWKNPHIPTMKQELPIAVVLLAAGGFFWLGTQPAPIQNQREPIGSQISLQIPLQDEANGNESAADQAGFSNFNQQATSFNVALTSFEEEAGNELGTLPNEMPPSQPVTAAALPSTGSSSSSNISQAFMLKHHWSESASQQSSEFLINLGAQIRDSIAFETDIKVDLNWRKQPMEILGRYSQIGQGSGYSRFQLEIPMAGSGSKKKSMTLVKVCDGQFLYTQLLSPGVEQSLEFIDLKQVHHRRLDSGLTEPNNPMSWIATGGLSSILENLGSAFQFGQLEEKKWNGITTVSVTGTWKTEQLAELLRERVERSLLEPMIQWHMLPVHLPHSVRIECVDRESVGLLPIKIEFFQFDLDEADSTRLLASIHLGAPRQLSMNPEDLLKLETDDSNTTDSTDQYVDQVRDFEFSREARLEEATLKR